MGPGAASVPQEVRQDPRQLEVHGANVVADVALGDAGRLNGDELCVTACRAMGVGEDLSGYGRLEAAPDLYLQSFERWDKVGVRFEDLSIDLLGTLRLV